MISLMLILFAVFTFVCAYFFLEAGKTGSTLFILSVGSILFMIGISNFISYLLEVLGWVF